MEHNFCIGLISGEDGGHFNIFCPFYLSIFWKDGQSSVLKNIKENYICGLHYSKTYVFLYIKVYPVQGLRRAQGRRLMHKLREMNIRGDRRK